MNFLKLPSDILNSLFDYLPITDIIHLSVLNNEYKTTLYDENIIKQNTIWRYLYHRYLAPSLTITGPICYHRLVKSAYVKYLKVYISYDDLVWASGNGYLGLIKKMLASRKYSDDKICQALKQSIEYKHSSVTDLLFNKYNNPDDLIISCIQNDNYNLFKHIIDNYISDRTHSTLYDWLSTCVLYNRLDMATLLISRYTAVALYIPPHSNIIVDAINISRPELALLFIQKGLHYNEDQGYDIIVRIISNILYIQRSHLEIIKLLLTNPSFTEKYMNRMLNQFVDNYIYSKNDKNDILFEVIILLIKHGADICINHRVSQFCVNHKLTFL